MGTKRATTATGTALDRRRSTDRRTPGTTGEPEPARKRRSTRDGREALVVSMPPLLIKSVKIAALERDTTASAIVIEAVDSWLRLHTRTGGR